ncbi:hypothetical protein [Streptomyces sp. CB01881]|uniref:hypothetical protein n=1 Tax=Streptomyces sp. CB01881 TaxID=2078691 RepID=UPI0011DF53EC|nr:hypothetical protein [Streptomyces sp. CB01881]TYC76374.1 hypothetical protein EH183_01750 [Streptomyces sp. CB01881]
MSTAVPPEYASIKLTTRLLNAGIEPSMGSVGDSVDDALADVASLLDGVLCAGTGAEHRRAAYGRRLTHVVDRLTDRPRPLSEAEENRGRRPGQRASAPPPRPGHAAGPPQQACDMACLFGARGS